MFSLASAQFQFLRKTVQIGRGRAHVGQKRFSFTLCVIWTTFVKEKSEIFKLDAEKPPLYFWSLICAADHNCTERRPAGGRSCICTHTWPTSTRIMRAEGRTDPRSRWGPTNKIKHTIAQPHARWTSTHNMNTSRHNCFRHGLVTHNSISAYVLVTFHLGTA